MMLDFEYGLFSGEDPIALLVKDARSIPFQRRWKAASSIRRAKALYSQSKKFRDIIRDDKNPNNMMIGLTFSAFFGETIDRGGFMVLPRSVTYEYLRYMAKAADVGDDKYMKKVTNLILAHSDSIDAFVKAFHSIRIAQGEIDKLKSA